MGGLSFAVGAVDDGVHHRGVGRLGPGESASFPTKWMSDGGRTLHLVFSGDDSFSVRRARLTTAKPE